MHVQLNGATRVTAIGVQLTVSARSSSFFSVEQMMGGNTDITGIQLRLVVADAEATVKVALATCQQKSDHAN